METTKRQILLNCQSKSFISIFFTCQVSACELQPFSCHDLADDTYSETAMKTVFSHLKRIVLTWVAVPRAGMFVFFALVGRTAAILDVAMLCALEGAQCKTRELP